MVLLDRLFRRQGVRQPGPLDRLAYIGDRAMGALRFEPADELSADAVNWGLLELARESERVLSGESAVALEELALAGGSPQGARPKVLVHYDVDNNQMTTEPDGPGEPWLVKFPRGVSTRRSVSSSSSIASWPETAA